MKEHLTLICTTVPYQLQTRGPAYEGPDRRHEVVDIWDHKKYLKNNSKAYCCLQTVAQNTALISEEIQLKMPCFGFTFPNPYYAVEECRSTYPNTDLSSAEVLTQLCYNHILSHQKTSKMV